LNTTIKENTDKEGNISHNILFDILCMYLPKTGLIPGKRKNYETGKESDLDSE